MDDHSLRRELKVLLIESARLAVAPDDIDDQEQLFGGGRLGLDSLDALQLAVSIDERFQVQIPDDEGGRACLRNILTLAAFVGERLAQAAASR